MSKDELQFTGERFLPSCEREIWYEHYHRYTMALNWVSQLDVLDAACGEGYGSHILAQKARSVVGVDLSNEAIDHARQTYQQENLRFIQSNVLDLEFEDNSFDVVVSFETLEHLSEHEALIKEFNRVLKPSGVLLISTPDKKEYSDKTGFDNEYHVKELYRDEFASLLNNTFKHSLWFGQKLMFSSLIWQLESAVETIQYDSMISETELADRPTFAPVYYVVIASHHSLQNQDHKNMYSFTEQAETIYGHYNAVIRAHIKAEQDFNTLRAKQEKWLKHPILSRCIKWFGKE